MSLWCLRGLAMGGSGTRPDKLNRDAFGHWLGECSQAYSTRAKRKGSGELTPVPMELIVRGLLEGVPVARGGRLQGYAQEVCFGSTYVIVESDDVGA